VVFLHAAVCDSRMWQEQWQAVGGQCRAIAYDRRGFGASRAEKQDHSAIGDLLAVIDALAEGKPAILVACSQGGRIALDAAILHPEHIRGLFLISPSLIGAPEPDHAPEIAALLAQQKQRVLEQGLATFRFAWAGSLTPGEAHYFRVHGPATLVEHDNTQNGANHIHAVWRDLAADFGRDALADHYRQQRHR